MSGTAVCTEEQMIIGWRVLGEAAVGVQKKVILVPGRIASVCTGHSFKGLILRVLLILLN